MLPEICGARKEAEDGFSWAMLNCLTDVALNTSALVLWRFDSGVRCIYCLKNLRVQCNLYSKSWSTAMAFIPSLCRIRRPLLWMKVATSVAILKYLLFLRGCFTLCSDLRWIFPFSATPSSQLTHAIVKLVWIMKDCLALLTILPTVFLSSSRAVHPKVWNRLFLK